MPFVMGKLSFDVRELCVKLILFRLVGFVQKPVVVRHASVFPQNGARAIKKAHPPHMLSIEVLDRTYS